MAEEYSSLQSIVIPNVQVNSKEKKIIYPIDLVFDTVPSFYWIYGDLTRRELELICYGTHIFELKSIKKQRVNIFSSVNIERYETKLGISKQQSSIFISLNLEPPWHYEAKTANNKTIRILVWKEIAAPTDNKSSSSKPFLKYTGILILSAICTIGVLFSYNLFSKK